MASARIKKRKGKPPLIVAPPGPHVRRPKGWKPPPRNPRIDKIIDRIIPKDGGKTMKKQHGGMTHVGLYPAEERGEDISRSTGTLSQAKRKRHMNKGGIVGDKKQGYKARTDESIAERVKKKRTKKQLVASRDESYGKWGKGKGKGKINQTDGNKLVASLYD